MNKNLIRGAERSLVELVLKDHNFLQSRIIKITYYLSNFY